MPQHTQRAQCARICPDCDGFPVVAITTGHRHADGSRATLRVACPACQGTGNARGRSSASATVKAGAWC